VLEHRHLALRETVRRGARRIEDPLDPLRLDAPPRRLADPFALDDDAIA
jgi:hypothetical protein